MFTRLKILASEPLFHFLLIGSLLYVSLEVWVPITNNKASQIITLEPKALVQFLQFQNKSFNAETAKSKYTALNAEEKQQLIDDYIREEVMFREAISLGLEENDQIIRRRLIQKIEFINLGFQSELEEISEAELNTYFDQHLTQYIIDASVTFTHVFFDQNQHKDKTFELASKTLKTLNKTAVPFSKAAQYGQRFFFHRNYVDRTPAFIGSHFGDDFSKQIFTLTPGTIWHGPIESAYGYHLVLLTKNEASRTPVLQEVASEVLGDLQRIRLSEMKQRALAKMINEYTIENYLGIDVSDNYSSTNSGEINAKAP